MAEMGKRIRAARGYAGLNQPELAELVEISATMLKRIELDQRGLKSYEIRGITERIADVCGLPAQFFTADLAQLEPGWQAPEDQLARLEAGATAVLEMLNGLTGRFDTVGAQLNAVIATADALEIRASEQLATGSASLERFTEILNRSIAWLERLEGKGGEHEQIRARLNSIEARLP